MRICTCPLSHPPGPVYLRAFWHRLRGAGDVWGVDRGWSLRSTPGDPAGVACGAGRLGSRRLAAQGASRSPSPAQRAGKDRSRQVPAQLANRSSRCPRGLWNGWPVGPDGVGVAATRACDPGWENRWPFGPNDGPFGRQRGQGHSPSTRGIITVFRSCVPSKPSPTQIPRRATKPPAGPGIVWVLHGHGRTRRSVGRSVRGVRAGPGEPRFLAPPSGCRRCGGVDRGCSLRSTPGDPLGPRRGRLWRGRRGSRRVAAQRANRSSRRPRGWGNGWPVGPDGVSAGATRACDPGWENGWPVGPDDGPLGRKTTNHANPPASSQRSAVRPQLPPVRPHGL